MVKNRPLVQMQEVIANSLLGPDNEVKWCEIEARHAQVFKMSKATGDLCVKIAKASDSKSSAGIENEVRILQMIPEGAAPLLAGHGVHDGRPWSAQTWVGASSVRQRVANLSSADDVIGEFVEALRGLAKLADAGVVHGDVQPDHLLWHDGYVLIDFESSYSAAAGPSRYQGGFVHFMPPEVFQAMETRTVIKEPKQTIDVYSVCVVMYLLWCRALPWNYGRSTPLAEKMAEIAKGRPMTFADRGAPVAPRLEASLFRGMRVDPHERWIDARALLQEIEGITYDVRSQCSRP